MNGDTFHARKPEADLANAQRAATRRLVSLGVSKQWVEGAGRNAEMREIEFEDLYDLDRRAHYRRYRDNPAVLVSMARNVEPDRVRTLGTFNTNAASGRYPTGAEDVCRPMTEPPDW